MRALGPRCACPWRSGSAPSWPLSLRVGVGVGVGVGVVVGVVVVGGGGGGSRNLVCSFRSSTTALRKGEGKPFGANSPPCLGFFSRIVFAHLRPALYCFVS